MSQKNKNSQNLEVVSKSKSVFEKRKHPRVTMGELQFRLDDNGKIFGVWDLSEKGLAIRIIDQEDLSLFSVGRHLGGTLKFNERKIKFKAQVVRQSQSLIGLEFEQQNSELEQALEQYLAAEKIGAQVHLLPSSDIGSQIWAHGPAGVDLLIRMDQDSGKMIQILFYFMGSFVRWNEDSGLETGVVVHADEQALSQGVLEYEPIYLKPEQPLSKDKLDYARRLLQNANIPEQIKSNSLQLLS